MTNQLGSLLLLFTFVSCRQAPAGAPLLGHWQFQQLHQVHYQPDGTVLEASTVLGHSSYHSLDITSRDMVYQHVLEDGPFEGDSTYLVTRSYTRQDSTLWVVPVAGIEAGPVYIHHLTDQHLTLRSAQQRVPGAPYSVWETSYTR